MGLLVQGQAARPQRRVRLATCSAWSTYVVRRMGKEETMRPASVTCGMVREGQGQGRGAAQVTSCGLQLSRERQFLPAGQVARFPPACPARARTLWPPEGALPSQDMTRTRTRQRACWETCGLRGRGRGAVRCGEQQTGANAMPSAGAPLPHPLRPSPP